jgi:hypothetical protein
MELRNNLTRSTNFTQPWVAITEANHEPIDTLDITHLQYA